MGHGAAPAVRSRAPAPPSRTCRPRLEGGGRHARWGRAAYTHGHVDERARLIGMNHVAVEVGDLDGALELYGRLFRFELRGGRV